MNYHNIINDIYEFMFDNYYHYSYYIAFDNKLFKIANIQGLHSYLYGVFDALQAYKYDNLQLSIIHNENSKKCIFLVETVA